VNLSFVARSRPIIALALIATVLSGIAGIASVRPATAQGGPEITMWLDTTGNSAVAQCISDKIVSAYNTRGGAQVKSTLQPNGWTATQTALAGGGGPDIVITPGPSFANELARAGQIVPLDAIAQQYDWSATFAPWALQLGRSGEQLFSVPNEVETLVLYYNKTLFEAKGWTPPTTIDQLMALGQTVDDAGVIPFAHAHAEWRPTNEWFIGEFLNHIAGPEVIYQALTGAIPWTDPRIAAALAPLNQMQTNGWFMGGLDRYYTTPSADAASALAYGDAAMKIEGTWFATDAQTYFDESGQEWDWVPMPSTDGTAIYDLGIGSTYSINAKSAHQPEAADFLNYYFSPETQGQLVTVCGTAPAPVTIPAENLAGLDARRARIITSLATAAQANDYGYTTWTFFPPKTEVYLYEEIEKVWAGDMTMDEYLQGAQAIFAQEFAAGGNPPVPART
jgi:raffinose/stachyose/melibiose transport system substrate-binding protein